MGDIERSILNLFAEMASDSLDLHTLFEAGGNDPQAREDVLEAVARMTRQGLLESRGSDFYSITPKGREALAGR